jgi:hypothetical protein
LVNTVDQTTLDVGIRLRSPNLIMVLIKSI